MNTYPLNEEQMFKDLRGLMQIKTINRNCGPMTDQMPLGEGVYNALQYVAGLAEKMGFKTKMLDGYSIWIEAGEGEKLVANLCHVDTVPVEDSGWVADPFDATLIDGKVYDAITNYGARPTFNLGEVLTESFIKNFDGDIYGKIITVFFVDFIRDIEKFYDADKLKEQLEKDKKYD